MSHQENITRIKTVYNGLGPLKDKVVFVGGATISLYREGNSPEVRATEDVDVVIEIWQYGNYAVLEEQLRSMGFKNDKESGIICRFKYGHTVVDVMPTEGKVLGFSNRWYPDRFKSAIAHTIDPQRMRIGPSRSQRLSQNRIQKTSNKYFSSGMDRCTY